MSATALPDQLSDASRAFAGREHQLLIDGERAPAADGRTFQTLDPATATPIASAGMWGLSGWFVQWLNNRLNVAVTFHPGVGLGEDSQKTMTPERGASYGLMGFAITGRMSQLPLPFPYVRACVIRANRLSYGHRVLIRFGYSPAATRLQHAAIEDFVIDGNAIDHSRVGIEVDGNALGVLLARNSFSQVAEQRRLAEPQRCLILH